MPTTYDLSTPTTSVAGPVAQAATWTNAARTDWPRYGYPGPASQFYSGQTVSHGVWFVDNPAGAGQNHLIMTPPFDNSPADSWMCLQYPHQPLSLNQNWEMACEINVGPAGFLRKVDCLTFGLGRLSWPGWPEEQQNVNATSTRTDSFMAFDFIPVAGTGTTSGSARVRYRLPGSGTTSTLTTSSSSGSVNRRWDLNMDRVFRVSYNASTRLVTMSQQEESYGISTAFTAQNITDMITSRPGMNTIGEWAFPWIACSRDGSATELVQSLVLKQFWAWGTGGTHKLPRGGPPFTGAGQIADDNISYGAVPPLATVIETPTISAAGGPATIVGTPSVTIVQPGQASLSNLTVAAGQLYPRGTG